MLTITAVIEKLSKMEMLNVPVSRAIEVFDDADAKVSTRKPRSVKMVNGGKVEIEKDGEVSEVRIVFPYTGVSEKHCHAVKFNYGLNTQCPNVKKSGEDYCTACLKKVEDGKHPGGDITDRAMLENSHDYVNGTGKKTITWATYLSKKKVSMEKAMELAESLDIEISEADLTTAPKKVRKMKDPAKKGRMNGYILFLNTRREEIKKTDADLKQTEISKMAGEEWRAMSDEDKEAWKARATEHNEKLASDAESVAQDDEPVAVTDAVAIDESPEMETKIVRKEKKVSKKAAKKTDKEADKAKKEKKAAKKVSKKTTKKSKKVASPVASVVSHGDDEILTEEMQEQGFIGLEKVNGKTYIIHEDGEVYAEDNLEEACGFVDADTGKIELHTEL